MIKYNLLKNTVKEKILRQFPCELDVVYGNGEKTKLDIYYPNESSNQTKGEFHLLPPLFIVCWFILPLVSA